MANKINYRRAEIKDSHYLAELSSELGYHSTIEENKRVELNQF